MLAPRFRLLTMTHQPTHTRTNHTNQQIIAAYLDKTVLPALRATAGGDALLAELSKRWGNHQ